MLTRTLSGFSLSVTVRCLLLSCSPCRRLSPVWSGWWLCMTLTGVQTATCPFNRATVSWSPSTSTLSGAAAGSTAERACSPGLLLRAAQVWSSYSIGVLLIWQNYCHYYLRYFQSVAIIELIIRVSIETKHQCLMVLGNKVLNYSQMWHILPGIDVWNKCLKRCHHFLSL